MNTLENSFTTKVSEEKEVNFIQESILKLVSSLRRLEIEIKSINIPKEDLEYLIRLTKSNPNWSGSKFCKVNSCKDINGNVESILVINNVKIRGI